jgi:adenylosuccinate lyase
MSLRIRTPCGAAAAYAAAEAKHALLVNASYAMVLQNSRHVFCSSHERSMVSVTSAIILTTLIACMVIFRALRPRPERYRNGEPMFYVGIASPQPIF